MIRNRTSKAARAFVWLVAAMLLALAAQATTPPQSSSAGPYSGIAYDQANEVTVIGTVVQFSHPAAGGPAGLHLLISASGKTVDDHLGPFFSKQNQE
ncbi:MAG: hypothetical protein WCC04_03300, partial [Terriglobales bacterium]